MAARTWAEATAAAECPSSARWPASVQKQIRHFARPLGDLSPAHRSAQADGATLRQSNHALEELPRAEHRVVEADSACLDGALEYACDQIDRFLGCTFALEHTGKLGKPSRFGHDQP